MILLIFNILLKFNIIKKLKALTDVNHPYPPYHGGIDGYPYQGGIVDSYCGGLSKGWCVDTFIRWGGRSHLEWYHYHGVDDTC